MSGRVRVAALLLTGLVVQATLFTEIRVQGASVELMMLMAILAGFHGGPQRGAIVAFCAGLLQDSIAATPLGLHALVFPPLAVAVSSLEQRMLRQEIRDCEPELSQPCGNLAQRRNWWLRTSSELGAFTW